MTRTERDIRHLLKDLGCKVLGMQQSKHYRVHTRLPDGREHTLIFSVTPSDRRAVLNRRKFIERLIAQPTNG